MIVNLPQIIQQQKGKPKIRKFKLIKPSRRAELWYLQQLRQFVKNMTSDIENALSKPQGIFLLDGIEAFNHNHLLDFLKKYAEKDRGQQIESIATGFVGRGQQQTQQEVAINLKNQTGVDLMGFLNNNPKVTERVQQLTAANIQLIKSVESQYLDKIKTAVTQAVITGTKTDVLAKQIKDIAGTTDKRATLIARDQSAKLNSAITQANHEELGITKYRWSTSGDERVRPSHSEKDGQVFEYANPPADTGNPGHDINCRCVAIPVLSDLEATQATEQYETKNVKAVVDPEQYAFYEKAIESDSEAKEFVKQNKLNTTEAVVMRDYTAHMYARINSALRNDKLTHQQSVFVKVLNRALSKLANFTRPVYHRVTLPEKALAVYVVGETITEKGFLSTSYRKFTDNSELHQFIIHSKRGKIIEKISPLKNEHEVLFKSGSKFKVLKRYRKNNLTIIELQEI